MMIDTANFTPGLSLLGGILAGTASALFILNNGRIAGITGILGGLLNPRKDDIVWRIAFLLGLIAAPTITFMFMPAPVVTVEAESTTLIIAGLLVGVGTRYGSGCTSGHGICGLSRLSPRSLIATLTFMAAGMAVVFVMRNILN